MALDDLGAELLRLRPHLGHQVGTHDAVAMPGKILDDRGQHELTAGFEPFDEERLQVGARGVKRGRQARRAGPDDDDVAGRH